MLTWLGADRLRLAGGLDSELRYLRWIVGATLEGILLYYPQLQFGGRGGGALPKQVVAGTHWLLVKWSWTNHGSLTSSEIKN